MSNPSHLEESLLYFVARKVLGKPSLGSSDDPYWECPACCRVKFHIFWGTNRKKWMFKCFACPISGDEDDLLWEKAKLDQGVDLAGKAEKEAKSKGYPRRKQILQKYRNRWLKTIRRHSNHASSPPDPPVINTDDVCPCGHVPILSLLGISADDVIRHHAKRIGANSVHVFFEVERHLKTLKSIEVLPHPDTELLKRRRKGVKVNGGEIGNRRTEQKEGRQN